MASAAYTILPNGVKMPLFGLGTWQSPEGEARDAVTVALNNGYRLIDTATAYGNEAEIGAALAEIFAEGKIKREDVFITTKLFWTHSREAEVEGQLRTSLEKLQLEYVDLYLIHAPVTFAYDLTAHDNSVAVTDTWKGMEAVYAKKLTRAIGLSNVNAEQIERVHKIAKVPIHNLQVECHLYFNQTKLLQLCRKLGISFTAYGPIGSPGRKNADLPGGVFGFHFQANPSPLADNLVKRFAEKYNKTPAQILLRHLVQREICVIPKSSNEKRIVENFDIFDFELTKNEVNALTGIQQHPRIFQLDLLAGAVEDPFKDERKTMKAT